LNGKPHALSAGGIEILKGEQFSERGGARFLLIAQYFPKPRILLGNCIKLRLGKAAKMPFSLRPHMLRHACGYKLANDGHDTRALQHYLGHKNIQHTLRYTELSPDRFHDFWRD
jgi:integrase